MQATDYFDKFADQQFAEDAGSVLGGYLAAEVAGNVIADRTVPGTDITVPQEAGGAAVIVGAEAAPVKGRMKRHMQVGGGVALLEDVLERANVRSTIAGLGGS